MKKIIVALGCLALIFAITAPVMAGNGKGKQDCATIQDGTLYASTGELLTTGYDEFGYNYQAHMYNGWYCEYQREPCPGEYTVELMMKWNDAWLSNKDCHGDGLLDRHFGFDSYIGSGAWLTNHQSGWVEMPNDKFKKWTYFVKIVAAPSYAYSGGGYWWAADGTQIGPVIWGSFAIIQEINNDPSLGEHGILYKSPAGPGFGKFKP